MKVDRSEFREALAALAHQQWSGWMEHLFRQCFAILTNTCGDTLAIRAESVERWQRQMSTPYAELPEEEKESDRAEADRVIALVDKFIAGHPELLALGLADKITQGIVEAAELKGELQFPDDLSRAIANWRNAEVMARIARCEADEKEALALLQVSSPDALVKLTNEPARKAYATEQTVYERLRAGILEAHARSLRFWVESLVGRDKLILRVADEA